MQNNIMDTINEKQAAKLLGVCPATLKSWREKGFISQDIYIEKQYYKIRRIKYNKEKLLQWKTQNLT
ncbi:MAG: helix-turn-helix domain-containing protein [Arcobacteraceae bacterium]